MAFDGIYRLQDPPLSGDIILKLQDKAIRGFASYSIPLGVTKNGLYDRATSEFVAEYQRRKQESGYHPILPANPTAKRGDLDAETKKALGLLPGAVVPGAPQPVVGYAVPGTWGIWNLGPQVMAVNRSPKVQVQGCGYNTSAFLNPDPMHSYVEAKREGVAELLRLSLGEPRKKIWSGYSMGADVVTQALYEWPIERRGEIIQVIKFGDPGHKPGFGKVGVESVNGGIAGIFTPDWAVPITNSYQMKGDMYGDAPGLLPTLYQVLVRMELSIDFVMYLFGWLTGIPLGGFGANVQQAPANALGMNLLGLGGGGGGLAGFGALSGILGLITPGAVTQTSGPISLPQMIFNLPGIVSTLIAALEFLFTNAHGRYWGDDNRLFNGMCAEDHAAATVTQLTAAA